MPAPIVLIPTLVSINMAIFYVVALLLISSGCALCDSDLDAWKKVWSAERTTTVRDCHDRLVALAHANLTVFGEFNRTTDLQLVQDFVSEKFSVLENQSEDSLVEVETGNVELPLLHNLTLIEGIFVGPRPVRNIAFKLSAQVYAKKKHCREAIDMLKSMKSSM